MLQQKINIYANLIFKVMWPDLFKSDGFFSPYITTTFAVGKELNIAILKLYLL